MASVIPCKSSEDEAKRKALRRGRKAHAVTSASLLRRDAGTMKRLTRRMKEPIAALPLKPRLEPPPCD